MTTNGWKVIQYTLRDLLFQGVPLWGEIILVLILSILVYFFVIQRFFRGGDRRPVSPRFARILNNPFRKRYQPASWIIESLGLRPGMTVVEIGPGPGTYTLEIARAVLPDGVVYAIDIQEEMIAHLKRNLEKQKVTNVIPIIANVEDEIPLEAKSVDAAFAVTVIPEIPDVVKALSNVRRVLRSGGLFADYEIFLDPDFPRKQTVIEWIERAGFQLVGERGGRFRYILVFRKSVHDE